MAQGTTRQRVKGGPGRGRWLALGGVAVVILVLTFALGMLVGRRSAHHAPVGQAAADPAKKPAPPPRRSGLVERVPERAPLQEKLTFYQALTAPLAAQPVSSKVDVAAKPEAPKPRPGPAREVPPVQSIAADARPGDWAVQAGAFKDRGQAEGVRKQLAGAGFDAYLLAVPAEGGEVRFKVRIGSFKTRDEAARVAERVRQARSPSAFVTPR